MEQKFEITINYKNSISISPFDIEKIVYYHFLTILLEKEGVEDIPFIDFNVDVTRIK